MLLGGLIGSAGLMACTFAQSYWLFVLSYSFAGIAVALVVTPAIVVLSHYFRRLLPLATALVLLATPVGSLVRFTIYFGSRRLNFESIGRKLHYNSFVILLYFVLLDY